ncbi:MAG: carboxypeptidase regulatory-like domain-containing protein [Acidobacteria bacterium]|nr:carboxypeptidase regulatory-like domain-containing protein [Acidobacteriota bacterium]
MKRNQASPKFHLLVAGSLALVMAAASPAFAKNNKDTSPGRLLTGKVLDRQDNPVPDAVVYVTDTRTRAMKTFIVGPDGVYRFPALATNVDYEIYALAHGKTSDTKRMSQFDDRKVVEIVLRVDMR